jgi:multidrug efflux pump subunit AcrB
MIILLGASALTTIKRDVWPEVEYGIMIITTRYPGASPEDVELNVTNKIEEELKGVTGIDRTSSVSMENISVITVFVDPDASDQDEVKSDVEEAVGRVTELPIEVTESPLVIDVKTSIFPVIEVGLTGDLPYAELREIARQLEKKLETLPGVSSVKRFGYRAREVKVEVDPDALSEYQIPLREIIGAILARNIRGTAGSFESYTSERNLVTLAQFRDPTEVGDVVVRSSFDGPIIRVKDLAVVRDDFEDARILSRMNGVAAISFQVNKKSSADAIRTVASVKRLIERESERMPVGVGIEYSNDFSRYVHNRFDVVQSNLFIGLVLVVIVLMLFLGIRGAFWVAMGIPVALLGAAFLMPAFDVYLDSITLAAMIIVLGIIVDDGIIIAENIQRHRERGASPLDAAVDGISEVFPPVITTILTTFLAFAPLFLMTGILGNFIFVIPLVVSLALAVSLVEAVVCLPSHLTMGLRKKSGEGRAVRGSWFNALLAPFKRAELIIVKLRYLLVPLFVAMLIASLWYAANFMKFELFPSSMAEQFNILIELPKGASLESTADHVQAVETLVAQLPDNELESFITRIGTQEVFPAAGYPPGENEHWAFVSVNLSPYTERDRTADDIVEALRAETSKLEGIEHIVYAIEAGGPPVGKPITVRVVGADDSLRVQLADSVALFLGTITGVKDIDRNDKPGKEQVEIKVDYDRLSRLGLTVADVSQNVRIAYDGEVVTSVRYGDEDVDFRVQLEREARENPRLLADLTVPNRQGRLIPLREVARFPSGPGPSNYHHFDNERAITISGDVDKEQVTPLEATTAVVEHFNLDGDWPGMRLVIGGEAEETEKSMISLFKAFAIAVVAIYFLLILLFNSPVQPLVVMAAIPFGIMGVIITFALHAEPLGFVAMMGVIGLAGVLVNDSLVLVNHINRLRKQKPDDNIRAIIAKGASDRLRPVLLTSLTTVAGLLPLAYGIGGSDPYMAPMALALAYGLVFATPITMILVPCLYMVKVDFDRLFRGKGELGIDPE